MWTPWTLHQQSCSGVCGVHISDDLTWSLNSSNLNKMVRQWLYFLHSLKRVHLCPRILVDFHCRTIESLLTNCISVWYGNCFASDCTPTGGENCPTDHRHLVAQHWEHLSKSIIKDASHPNHGLFILLPSARRYRSLLSHTNRLRKSFFPEAVTQLNFTPQRSLLHCPFLHRLNLSRCSDYCFILQHTTRALLSILLIQPLHIHTPLSNSST